MGEKSSARLSTEFSSTEVPPTTTFRYVFDVTNFKVESERIVEYPLDRAVESQPYKWLLTEDKKDYIYGGTIRVRGQPGDVISISSSLNFMKRDNYYCAPTILLEHSVTAELLCKKTSVVIESRGKGELRRLKESDYMFIDVKQPWLHEKCEAFGATPVTLRITVELNYLPKHQSSEWNDSTFGITALNQNPPYLKALRSNQRLFDVTIVCGGKEFRAHKIILSATSSVFARMLEAPMEEATAGRIVIEDVEPESMQLLIEYIYTGQCVPDTSDEAIDLLYCAEKYGLEDLKKLMLRKMAGSLSEENAVKYLNAAMKVGPGSPLVTDMIAFCKSRFIALCALNSENKKFLAAHLDLFCSTDHQ